MKLTEKYSISCWEIDRYEVHLYYNGRDLGGNNSFDTEEEAVAFGQEYIKKYPDWTFCVLKIARACFEFV